MTKLSKVKLEDIVYKSLQEELIEFRSKNNRLLLKEDDHEPDLWGNFLDVATGGGSTQSRDLQPGTVGDITRNVPFVGEDASFQEFMLNKVLPVVIDAVKIQMCNYLIDKFGVDPRSLRAHVCRAFVVELTLQDVGQLLGLTDNPILDCKHYSGVIAEVITNVIGTYMLIPMVRSMYDFATGASKGTIGADGCFEPIFGGDNVGGGGRYLGKFLGGNAFNIGGQKCPPGTARIDPNAEVFPGHVSGYSRGGWKSELGSWDLAFGTILIDKIDDHFGTSDLLEEFIADMMCEEVDGISKFQGMKNVGANIIDSAYYDKLIGGTSYVGDFARWVGSFITGN